MFKSIQFTKGFALDLPGISDHIFEFDDSINVLYGPNGSGKTTILKMLAATTGLDMTDKLFGRGAAWSRPPKANLSIHGKFDLQDLLVDKSPGKCRANVDWDGMPTFYNSASISDAVTMTHFACDESASADGITDMGMQMAMIKGHQSEGELRKMKMVAVMMALEKRPEPYTEPQHKDDKAQKAYADWVASLPRNGKRTLLWDEPDRSLDAETQIGFWTTGIHNIAKKFDIQVIITSHSFAPPLLAGSGKLNVIELHEGKIRKMQESVYSMLELSWGRKKSKESVK